MLLLTFQFTWQARQAQIDATLCFLTTLSLYGLLRHLLVAPALGWFVVGWAAAGLGVITKGVGFLPLLALLPVGVLACAGLAARPRAQPALAILGPIVRFSRRFRSGSCRCGRDFGGRRTARRIATSSCSTRPSRVTPMPGITGSPPGIT